MKERLDVLLVEQGYAASREKAKAIIMSGSVFVNGQREDKAGSTFDPAKSTIEVKGHTLKYVSLGGLKLEKAIEQFDIGLEQKVCMDIGASTGGTEAIFDVIKNFGQNIPGVVVVQHMPPVFTAMYAERLNRQCLVTVKEAQDGDYVRRGQVLIAPGDKHMRLVKSGGVYRVECKEGEKVSGHCPSVDVLFQSVAEAAGDKAIGVILTGMGADGAKGLLAMRKAGAQTIGQDEASCVVYGMPKVAYDNGAVQHQVSLTQVADKVHALLNQRR